MITPQDILRLLDLPTPPESAISAPSVAFPTEMSESEFLDHVCKIRLVYLTTNIVLTKVLIYHTSIYVGSVAYWTDPESQTFLVVELPPCISSNACRAIEYDLALIDQRQPEQQSTNPFTTYINTLDAKHKGLK